MRDESKLRAVKLLHTAVWAVFAGSIVAIPGFTYRGAYEVSWGLVGFVFLEVLVLVLNGMRCPLTNVAARYTDDRLDDFDIYLPLFVARYNKQIFGGLYLVGIVYTALASLE